MNALPPLNALRAFEATARLGSMSAAARELAVTHGAISRQIGILESYLGVSLFHREGRQLRLSKAGESLFPATRGAFELLSNGCQQLRRQQRPTALQVACPGTYMLRWLIPRLHRWQAHAPGVEVRLSTLGGTVDLHHHGIDLLIDAAEPPWPRDWQVTALFPERFGPVASPALLTEHPVQQAHDLLALPRLHTASRLSAWQEWARAVEQPTLPLQEGQRFAQLVYMLEAASAGIGVALAPEVLVEADLVAGRLQAPLGFVASGRVYIAANLADNRDARVARFRQWLLQESRLGA